MTKYLIKVNVDEDIEDNNNKKEEKESFVPTDNTPRAPTGGGKLFKLVLARNVVVMDTTKQ